MPAQPTNSQNEVPLVKSAKFRRILKLLAKPDRTLFDCHAAGKLLLELNDDLGGYRQEWAGQLSDAVSTAGGKLSPSLAYKLIKFAKTYSEAQVVRRLSGRLTLDGVLRLVVVKDPRCRDRILKAIPGRRHKPLSAREVQALIRSHVPYRAGRGGAEPTGPSAHPIEALRSLRILVRKWPKTYAVWREGKDSALIQVRRMHKDELSKAFRDTLEQTTKDVKKMAGEAEQLASKLDGLVKRFGRRFDATGAMRDLLNEAPFSKLTSVVPFEHRADLISI